MVVVNDGSNVALSGTTVADTPSLAGEVAADELVPFGDASAGIGGTLQRRVVRIGAGSLDFYYRINELTGGGALWGVTYRFLGRGITTDTDFRVDGLGQVGPAHVNRRDWPLPHDLIDLTYTFERLTSGSDSRFVFVKTNATEFERGMVLSLSGGRPMWLAGVEAFLPPYTPRR